MRRLLTGIASAGGGARRASGASGASTPSQDELPSYTEDSQSTGIDCTQEVVWRESPKFYKPRARHSTDRVKQELTIIEDMLADKENNRGPLDPPPPPSSFPSASQGPIVQQHHHHHSQPRSKAPLPSPAEGGGSRLMRRGRPVGGGGSAAANEGEGGVGSVSQRGGAKGGFSTSMFRSLLFRKSPAVARRKRRPSLGATTPTRKQGQQQQAGSASSASSSTRKRARPASLSESPYDLFPPPSTRPRSPSSSNNPSPSLTTFRRKVNCLTKKDGKKDGGGAARGGMSLLGGLAESLKQRRFKLNLWQPSQQQQQTAAEGSATGRVECEQEGRGQNVAVGASSHQEDEVGTQRFLHILEKIEEKLSQDDTRVSESEEEEDDEEEEDQDDNDEEEEEMEQQMVVPEEKHDRSQADGTSLPMDIDQEINPAPPPEPSQGDDEEVGVEEQKAIMPSPPQPSQSHLVGPPPFALMEVVHEGDQGATTAAVAAAASPPPPSIPPATVTTDVDERTNNNKVKAQKSQPWEDDELQGWTENDWAQILELTQGPAPPSQMEAGAEVKAEIMPPPEPSIDAALPCQEMTQRDVPVPTNDLLLASAAPVFSCLSPPPLPPPHPAEVTDMVVPAPSASSPPSPRLPYGRTPYVRYQIKAVQDNESDGRSKIVRVLHEDSGWLGNLTIRDPWCQCPLKPGTIVHVIETEGSDSQPDVRQTVIDREQNYLIIHPDVLISPSSVVSGATCERKAVLSDTISSSAFQSAVAVMGNLKHSMVQDTLLLLNDRDRTFPRLIDGSIVEEMERVADSVVARNRLNLHGMAIPEAQARQELLDLIRPIVDWTRLYCIPGSHQAQQQQGDGGGPIIRIERTERVEENVWSAVFGLKGQIDATVLAKPFDSTDMMQSPSVAAGGSGDGPSPSLLPVELKSGSSSADRQIEHRAQLMLYSLLLRDRYGQSLAYNNSATSNAISLITPQSQFQGGGTLDGVRAGRVGVLAYVKSQGVETIPVPPKDRELRQLLHVRNRVAHAFVTSSRSQTIPTVLRDQSKCSRCFHVADCMVYHRALEAGTAHTSALGSLFDEITGHLEAKDHEYLSKWDGLIGLESNCCSRLDKNLWHRKGVVEEAKGSKCLSDMVCVGVEARTNLDGPFYVYTFCRRKWTDVLLSSQAGEIPRSLLDLSVNIGDRVLISTESRIVRGCGKGRGGGENVEEDLVSFQHINMTNGNIIGMTESSVDIVCKKALAVPGYPGFPFITAPSPSSCSLRDEFVGSSRTHLSQAGGKGGGPAALSLAYEESSGNDDKNTQGAVAASQLSGKGVQSRGIIFRIDKDSSSLNFAMMRYNVVRLFTGPGVNVNAHVPGAPSGQKKGLRLAALPGDEKRRRLVVHLDAPRFTQPPSEDPREAVHLLRRHGLGLKPPPNGCTVEELLEEFQCLNSDQQAAMEKVLTARDYSLLLGMPGTGKTWTLAFIVRALVCVGKTVLITSYTHTAVDNLLLKLRQHQVPFLRLGRASSVNPALHDALLESGDALSSPAALEARLKKANVVATTCLGIKHALLATRQFDVCIVDEAGQILEPVCLGPIRSANAFVLVGDDNQLPPLVVSNKAQEGGMTESLFGRLAKAHPISVQHLTYQYRMNRDIMYVCNELVYEHRLKCGDETVANATLILPQPERLRLLQAEAGEAAEMMAISQETGWLERCLANDQLSVLFLNTDGISPDPLEDGLIALEGADCQQGGGRERDKDCPSNLTNPTEARLVCQLVSGLILGGIRPGAMAVISPLRSQVKRLKREMAHIRRLEINTVDKLQGMDRDCIIISLVRSNVEGRVGGLLQDRRRINVAVSRAKRKLILVGSVTTLSQAQTTGDLVNVMREKGWIVDLPANAHLAYEERSLDVVSAVSSACGAATQ